MGREVRRVPMDFDHPLGETWPGFVNDHYRQCAECGGSGATHASQWLEAIVSLLMCAGDDGARGRLHPWLASMPNRPDCSIPPQMAELTAGLAGCEPSFLGHDACDRWSAQAKIIEAAGLPETWGHCTACGGDGIHPDNKAAYEAWEKTPPPTGDGWQMWENTSEGSPISPVFATPEELARWLADMGASALGRDGASYESWLGMIRSGWAPDMVMDGRGVRSGVEFAGEFTGGNE